MPRSRTHARLAALLALLALPIVRHPALAQAPDGPDSTVGDVSRRISDARVWVDAAFGPTPTWGGPYAFNGSLGARAALTIRLVRQYDLELGGFASGRGRWYGGCYASSASALQGCAGFPAADAYTVAIGSERPIEGPQLGARLALGAGSYRMRDAFSGDVRRITGFHVAANGASPIWKHLGIATELRLVVLPHAFGRTLWLAPLTIGLRAW